MKCDGKPSFIDKGSITSPQGFLAGATYCHSNPHPRFGLDLGLLYCLTPCSAAGVFTTNRLKSAPVLLCQSRLPARNIRAVVVNSGCANAATGERGLLDAMLVTELAGARLGVSADTVLMASTGVIGTYLDVARIGAGISQLTTKKGGGLDFARAILTTDTVPKVAAINCGWFSIGAVAKGSGMIHPQMGTLLCFLTTDAPLELGFMSQALRKAVDVSFNMVSVDGDMSPNDSVLLLASGVASGPVIGAHSPEARVFGEALEQICVHLAREIARDGEGATKLLTVSVQGAKGKGQARKAARTVVSSSLVKAAIHGGDLNWGRIVAALGRSGVEMDLSHLSLGMNGLTIVKEGTPQPISEIERSAIFSSDEVNVDISLGLGSSGATAWGCDLSEEYVTINSTYTT